MKPVRITAALVAGLVLAGSLILTGCRLLTPGPQLLVMATSFVPYAVPGYLVALILLWWQRRYSSWGIRRWLTGAAVVSAVGLLMHLVWLAPSYVGGHPLGRPDLTVMTLNMRLGRADAAEIAGLARTAHADVIVLEEVTSAGAVALADEGLGNSYPFHAGAPGPSATGTVVLSKVPVLSQTRLAVANGAHLVRLGGEHPTWLAAVHTVQPGVSVQRWRADLRAVEHAVQPLNGPAMLAGDFNATLDHGPLRDLLGLRFADAATQSNSGWLPTYPSDPRVGYGLPFWVGAIAIDHVLVDPEWGTVSTQTFEVSGTDHRALVARLRSR